jgi:hypothetical protein
LVSETADSARARLIRTRRGTWIDESLLPAASQECRETLKEAHKAVGEDVVKVLRGEIHPTFIQKALDPLRKELLNHRLPEEEEARKLAQEARKTAGVCGGCGRKLSANEPAYFGAKVYVGMRELNLRSLLPYSHLKLQTCEPHYMQTVLCGSCAPEWLSPARDDVTMQLCAHCERPMVLRLILSNLKRMYCSGACGAAYHNQLRKEKKAEEHKKVCEVCGEEFTTTQNAKTCSPRCRQKAYRRRTREVKESR